MERTYLEIVIAARDQFTGTANKIVGSVSRLESGAKRMSSAFSRAGGAIKGLIGGPLGLIGLGGALFGVEKFLSSSVSKAEEFGVAVANVKGITGATAQATSALVDTLDYFGISADKQTRIIGLAEKNLGLLSATTTKAGSTTEQLTKARNRLTLAELKLDEVQKKKNATGSQILSAQQKVAEAEANLAKVQANRGKTISNAAEFEKKYGFALLDASGKVKDFNTLLLQGADYFNNKSIPAQTKAAALAKIFGRTWQELIPLFLQGSAKLRDAEKNAIKLSDADIASMADFKEASREWEDALGDLQIIIGVKLLPSLTSLARAASKFVNDHQSDIGKFFKDAAAFAQELGRTIQTNVLPIFGAIKDAWDKVPDDLKRLLIGGFVANKASKFLFDFGIGDLAKVGAGIFGRGATPANPVYVADVTGLKNGLPDNIIKGSVAASLAAIGLSVAAAAVIVAAGGALANAIDPTAVGPGKETLYNRDPRRFNKYGQVVRNSVLSDKGGTHGIAFGGHSPFDDSVNPGGMGAVAGAANQLQAAAAKLIDAASIMRQAKEDVPKIIAGIRARSAARYGGTGLGMAAVNATFERASLRLAENTMRSGASAERKLARLTQIQAELKAHGDVHAANRIGRDIKRLQAVLHSDLKKVRLQVTLQNNITNLTKIDGRKFTADTVRYSTVIGALVGAGVQVP